MSNVIRQRLSEAESPEAEATKEVTPTSTLCPFVTVSRHRKATQPCQALQRGLKLPSSRIILNPITTIPNVSQLSTGYKYFTVASKELRPFSGYKETALEKYNVELATNGD